MLQEQYRLKDSAGPAVIATRLQYNRDKSYSRTGAGLRNQIHFPTLLTASPLSRSLGDIRKPVLESSGHSISTGFLLPYKGLARDSLAPIIPPSGFDIRFIKEPTHKGTHQTGVICYHLYSPSTVNMHQIIQAKCPPANVDNMTVVHSVHFKCDRRVEERGSKMILDICCIVQISHYSSPS